MSPSQNLNIVKKYFVPLTKFVSRSFCVCIPVPFVKQLRVVIRESYNLFK